jgi:hypothetical protein
LLRFENEFTTLVGALSVLSQSVDDPLLRRALGRVLTGNVPKLVNAASAPASPLWAEGLFSVGSVAERLDVRGILARLSNNRLHSLQGDLEPARPRDEFFLNQRPSNVLVAGFKTEDVIRCTDLVKLVCEPAIVEAVSACLGCTPTISRLHTYYSFPGQRGASAAFRRNLDDFSCIKLLVYLTDVGPEDGPHQFIPYSHRFESLNQYFRSTGKKTDVRSLFAANSRNLATAELESLFTEDIITLTGATGFAFLEDAYGLHRERTPTATARLVFSCLYTGLPLRFGDENLRKHEMGRTISFSEAGLDNPSELQRYMLRYYLNDVA